MASIKQYIIFFGSLVSFVYTLFVITDLVYFLSAPRKPTKIYTWVFNLLDNRSRLETAYGPMVLNTIYLILFIFQHSFMKAALVRKIIKAIGLETAERTIYCLTSSLCLHYLMKKWLTASSIILWQMDVESNKWMWWSYVLLHASAWLVIFGGSITLDLPYLVGIKQPYYDMKSYAPPLNYKFYWLARLIENLSHPSFVGFTVIFWATNLMSLDRLLMAILLTAYMYLAWSTDENDLKYQKSQLRLKWEELKNE